MKKIFNWTFGGFFRTIGRTLAFLLIGGLIGIIALKNNFKITDLLGIEKVSAAVTNAPVTSKRQLVKYCPYNLNSSNCEWKSGDINTQLAASEVADDWLIELSYRVESSDGWNANIPYNISFITQFENTPLDNSIFRKYYTFEIWTGTAQDGSNMLIGQTNNNVMNFSCSHNLSSDKGSIVINCSFVPNRKIKRLQLFFKFRSQYYRENMFNGFNHDAMLRQKWIKWTNFNFTYDQDESAVINNQTQVIQDQTNQIIEINQQINDTLTDDNISDNEYSDELDDLEINNDTWQGPFSAFLLLPLNWVQNILASNQTCQAITFPLPYVNKNLTLPCMTDFWTSLGALGTFVQLVWIAIVGVRIFNGLFLLTVDVTSADGNADELTKIRSWEL